MLPSSGHPPHTVTIVAGTRPEAIKLAPVLKALEGQAWVVAQWVSTGQHGTMLEQAQKTFGITPTRELQVMRPNQTPLDVVQAIASALHGDWRQHPPGMVVVQGDTATAFAAALVAFYLRIPVAHVEAGLRSDRMDEPFPEEAHRRMIAPLTSLHFPPTRGAAENLLREGVAPAQVFTVGNTVVDALQSIAGMNGAFPLPGLQAELEGRRIVLVTAHRRENHGERLRHICRALCDIHDAVPDVAILFPVHLNPQVQETVYRELPGRARIHLLPPMDYFPFVACMARSYLILTDSGGVQEEAPSFHIPVLVLREQTERPEAVEAGMARLVGADRERIASAAISLLTEPAAYNAMRRGDSPFGDGKSGLRIVDHIRHYLEGRG